ncbi:C-GCAxxG-C-C family (seleno)protein [Candidatus Cloacimonadota bacterium]
MKVLSERFDISLTQQVLNAGLGMNGAGKYQAQCGLAEGALMFLGILGKSHHLPNEDIVRICHDYAEEFVEKFGSLNCKKLRPEGFHPDNPPHLCEQLAIKTITFGLEFISRKGFLLNN